MSKRSEKTNDVFTKKPGGKRFVVIDGNHLVHRAFYAIAAPLKTSLGEPTNALFGFASMLLNIIEAEKPDYMAVTFDVHAPTFRHEAYVDYKATRVKAPDDLYAQIPRVQEMLEAFKMPVVKSQGYEADDLMGTLALQATKEGVESYVVTGDMDALQLVNHHVHVVAPHKGYKEPMIYDAAKVVEKYGVHPSQIVDYKALMGDSSDNIKGVSGIGPKRAAELLMKYKSLDGIYGHLDEIKGTVHDKLKAGREDAYFAQKLARIVTNVPCDFDLEMAEFSSFDFQGLQRFLEQMEMHSLQRRLKKVFPKEALVSKDQMSLF